jgi:hypothetical protein
MLRCGVFRGAVRLARGLAVVLWGLLGRSGPFLGLYGLPYRLVEAE